jgi:probable rRNA maturation factor
MSPEPLRVEIRSRFRPLPMRATIRAALRAAARAEEVPAGSEVGVLVCDDAEIADYNRRFAGEAHATDVLSFSTREAARGGLGFVLPDEAAGELGDIVISLDHVKAQAEAAGHGIEEEAAMLAVHGFLHLLGYDHRTKKDERRMFGRTAEILASMPR